VPDLISQLQIFVHNFMSLLTYDFQSQSFHPKVVVIIVWKATATQPVKLQCRIECPHVVAISQVEAINYGVDVSVDLLVLHNVISYEVYHLIFIYNWCESFQIEAS